MFIIHNRRTTYNNPCSCNFDTHCIYKLSEITNIVDVLIAGICKQGTRLGPNHEYMEQDGMKYYPEILLFLNGSEKQQLQCKY